MGEETFERLYAAVNGALKYHLPVMDAFIEALEPGDNLGNGLMVVREDTNMSDTKIVPMETSRAVNDIMAERMRQKTLKFEGTPADEFDTINTRNDWVSYINAYTGRATICHRNFADGHDFREMMIKVGALAAAAIEAHDKEYC